MDIEKFLFIRNYDGKRLLLDATFLGFIGWLVIFVCDNTKSRFPSYIVNAPESIRFLVWVFITLIIFTTARPAFHIFKCVFFSKLRWSRTRNYYFPYNLNSLIFQGRAEISSDELFVTNSESGVLIKDLWWKDFTATFKFKFPKTETAVVSGVFDSKKRLEQKLHKFNYVGFLFRAQGLEDYFMLSIGVFISEEDWDKQADKNVLGITVTPHIRLGGKWEKFGGEGLGANIEINKFNSVRCEVVGVHASIEINGKRYNWDLPTNFDKVVINSETKDPYDPNKLVDTFTTTIPFRETFGMIGFRAMGAEKVYLKDINIKRLG